MSQFATAAELRDFMEVSGTTGRKSDTNLNLILQNASDWLERRTGRIITASASNTTRYFSSNNAPSVVIPDLRAVTSVTLQSATLTADQSYWLIPSSQAPDVYTGLQLRPFGLGRGYPSYLANPEWFDRNLDSPLAQHWGSTPNDLEITGLWGWTTTPPSWKLATLALAAYTYHHADALFASARATPEGNLLDMSDFPSEVKAHIHEWEIGTEVVLT